MDLYPTAVVGWEGFVAVNKTWLEWKEHFIKAYTLREASGITAGGAGYHGADNAFDDNVTLNESLRQLQVVNNAAMQVFQSNIFRLCILFGSNMNTYQGVQTLYLIRGKSNLGRFN